MSFLKNLPYPGVIEELNYYELLKGIKELFKSYLTDKEISLLESDNYSALLETLAYRELLLRARINSSVKAMLLPFSSGSDLDNIVAIYGIERLKGEKPTAQSEFTLSMPRSSDTYLPKGLILRSENGKQATLKSETIIRANELKAVGTIVLDEFVKTSKEKCEYIQTPLPFVLKTKQLSEFEGGAERESDDRLRERAVLSLERFSTAGSAKAYTYQTLSANAKVLECSVLNGGAGVVQIYLKTTDMSEETRADVESFLSAEKVRPLTDNLSVLNATKIDVKVIATLELTDMLFQDEIAKSISALPTSLSLGEDLNLSYIYKNLHTNGVYRVSLKEPLNDKKISVKEFVNLSYEISYKKAEL